MKKEKIKNRIISICIFLLVCVWMIPVYYMVVSTFKTGAEVATSPLALPSHFSFDAYMDSFVKMQYPKALFNTAFISVMTVLINVTVSTFAAYTLARRDNRINRFIYMFFIFGMMVPVQMGLSSL